MTDPRPSKAEIRRWMTRAREDLRDLELALASDDAEAAWAQAEDLSGTGGSIFELIESRYPETAPTH